MVSLYGLDGLGFGLDGFGFRMKGQCGSGAS